jgi:hypothetical protein
MKHNFNNEIISWISVNYDKYVANVAKDSHKNMSQNILFYFVGPEKSTKFASQT